MPNHLIQGPNFIVAMATVPPDVTQLNFSETAFLAQPQKELLVAIEHTPPQIRALSFQHTGLRHKTAPESVAILKAIQPPVVSLVLADANLGLRTGEDLQAIFSARPQPFEVIDLNSNRLDRLDGNGLYQAFSGISAYKVSLAYNRLASKTAAELSVAFSSFSKTVEILDLSDNDLASKTGRELLSIFGGLSKNISTITIEPAVYQKMLASVTEVPDDLTITMRQNQLNSLKKVLKATDALQQQKEKFQLLCEEFEQLRLQRRQRYLQQSQQKKDLATVLHVCCAVDRFNIARNLPRDTDCGFILFDAIFQYHAEDHDLFLKLSEQVTALKIMLPEEYAILLLSDVIYGENDMNLLIRILKMVELPIIAYRMVYSFITDQFLTKEFIVPDASWFKDERNIIDALNQKAHRKVFKSALADISGTKRPSQKKPDGALFFTHYHFFEQPNTTVSKRELEDSSLKIQLSPS